MLTNKPGYLGGSLVAYRALAIMKIINNPSQNICKKDFIKLSNQLSRIKIRWFGSYTIAEKAYKTL